MSLMGRISGRAGAFMSGLGLRVSGRMKARSSMPRGLISLSMPISGLMLPSGLEGLKPGLPGLGMASGRIFIPSGRLGLTRVNSGMSGLMFPRSGISRRPPMRSSPLEIGFSRRLNCIRLSSRSKPGEAGLSGRPGRSGAAIRSSSMSAAGAIGREGREGRSGRDGPSGLAMRSSSTSRLILSGARGA